MQTKPFYKSKTVWFNVIMTGLAIASLAQVQGMLDNGTLALVQGVGNIILRVWFTNTKL